MSAAIDFFISLVLIVLLTFGNGSAETDHNYQSLYEAAVDAYMQERWPDCMSLMDRALKDYYSYQLQLNQCRENCRDDALSEVNETNFFEAPILEVFQKRSRCIANCTAEAFPGRLNRYSLVKHKEIETQFQDSTPYDYLQLCAFKTGDFDAACQAAFTFASARPDHPYAMSNLDYYQTLVKGKTDCFVNLEPRGYQLLRREAITLYMDEKWSDAIKKFEESIAEYLKAEEACCAKCDAAFEEPHFSDFYKKVTDAKFVEESRGDIANIWFKVLSCKESCGKKLAIVNGTVVERFFLDQFHYLQYSYYKNGDHKSAAKNVATFLLFSPTDRDQMYNKIFYVQQGLAVESDFIPRDDAKQFYRQRLLLNKLKKSAEEEISKRRGNRNYKVYTYKSDDVYGPRSDAFLEQFYTFAEAIGVKVVSESKELGGSKRLVVDQVASPEECVKLIQLVNLGQRDKLSKVTVSKAAEFVRDGKASAEQVGVFMQTSEKIRHILEKYHNLKVSLLFQKTQLIYRAPDKELGFTDNMKIENFDDCPAESFTTCTVDNERDFMVYLHLDKPADEGSLYFINEDDPEKPRIRVEPKRGRMVGLTADDKHFIESLKSKRRHALVVYFTLSPAHQELDHAEARTTLKIIQGGTAKSSKISLDSLNYMKSKHYTLSLDEEDLNGPERFAADGLATEEECHSLIRLANSIGSAGSGYRSGFSHTTHESFVGVTIESVVEIGGSSGDGYTLKSPHTRNEVFEGLNVHDAAKLASAHKVATEDVKLYLRLSNEMKELTRRVLVGDERSLYFSFTHLVCRTALDGGNLDRTDLSHPIHSDNCIIQEDNSCKKVRPAYIERDYSAILYLNDDFFGGDFFFAHQNMSVQSSVKPKCGRVVSFNAGHYHGVKPVLSGQRCAVAIWFTLDREFDEPSHPIAEKMIEELTAKAFGPGQELRVEL